jgi:L-2-hydroxyglutarate oxidase LhgO
MLPFKGIYLYCDPERVKLRTHIYPVPNLNTPFLGVHFTLTVDGIAKIGPTAIPGLFAQENKPYVPVQDHMDQS